jgi:hypothetical protein
MSEEKEGLLMIRQNRIKISKNSGSLNFALVPVLLLTLATLLFTAYNLIMSSFAGGNLSFLPGNWVAAGYEISMPGNHQAAEIYMTSANVTLNVSCTKGGQTEGVIVVPLSKGPIVIPANSKNEYPDPDGKQSSSLKYQGAVMAPAICGAGKPMYSGSQEGGAAFSADVKSNDTADKINVKFHYVIPAVKGNPDINCADPIQNPAPGNSASCNSGWGSTFSLWAGPYSSSFTESIGDTSGSRSYSPNYVYAYNITASSSGILQSVGINLYATGGSSYLSMALFADSGSGSPAGLLANSGIMNTTTGWNDLSMSPTNVGIVSGNTYWIAFETDTPVLSAYSNASASSEKYCVIQKPIGNGWDNLFLGFSNCYSGDATNLRMTLS